MSDALDRALLTLGDTIAACEATKYRKEAEQHKQALHQERERAAQREAALLQRIQLLELEARTKQGTPEHE